MRESTRKTWIVKVNVSLKARVNILRITIYTRLKSYLKIVFFFVNIQIGRAHV